MALKRIEKPERVMCNPCHCQCLILMLPIVLFFSMTTILCFLQSNNRGFNSNEWSRMKCTTSQRTQESASGGGGRSPGKCIPLLGRHRETPTLTGTTVGPKSIPLLAQLHWKGYSLWHNYCWKVLNCYNCWHIAPEIRPILRNFWHSTLSLAQQLKNPYPFWHKSGVQNPTLNGTLLKNPTLCGTEIGQNGTLAVLAYEYCCQWECPPPEILPHHSSW